MKTTVLILLLPALLLSCSPPDSSVKDPAGTPPKSESATEIVKPKTTGDIDLKTAKEVYDDAAAGKLKIIVLDIRTPQEYSEGHLKGAVNLDYLVPQEEFRAELQKLDRNANYLMHCQSGGRSSDAAEIMEELGFTSVYHLKAGFGGWKRAGYEIAKD